MWCPTAADARQEPQATCVRLPHVPAAALVVPFLTTFQVIPLMAKIKSFRDRLLTGLMFVLAFFRLYNLHASASAAPSDSLRTKTSAGLMIGPVASTQTASAAPQQLLSTLTSQSSLISPEESCSCSCSCGCSCSCSCCV